eukprot:TRINITY_DN56231_c0_g1_i1.p1 TRINITY_DN56231_c0_g1~~TRINITY_DN56231_c0_g1_i1.p1  ORF type:complete len:782 (-),score=165.34 TRINITY_DN56231_c0_g1_i1:203-2548(-)
MSSSTKDPRKRASMRFQQFFANVLIEGPPSGLENEDVDAYWSAAVSAALRVAADMAKSSPKYFSGEAPVRGVIDGIEQVTLQTVTTSGMPPSKVARSANACGSGSYIETLYSDMFYLCTVLKPRPREPATTEDPNFSAELLDQFLGKASPEELEASLVALGGLLDSIFEQGVDELASSPPKLRSLLVMLAHAGLADGVDPSSTAFEVLKKIVKLVWLVTEIESARDLLVGWFALLPLVHLERGVALVQQFLTLSLLCAQADIGSVSSLEATIEIARRDDLAGHVRNALRLMDLYWKANEMRRRHGHDWRTRRKAQLLHQSGQLLEGDEGRYLPASQFQNDAINENEGILKHELKEMLEKQLSARHLSSDAANVRRDFGVIEFPFVLTPVSKVRMMNIESLFMQREEVRNAMAWQVVIRGSRMSRNPFLILKVRRAHVVEDALQQLAANEQQQFKKPLKVIFDGEEGVDEGGVQKEFFQLLVEELYNEDFGMFERIDESRTFWFNKNSFETNLQFELFGIVVGLAIYNQVILDVRFPMAVYKKLLSVDEKLTLSDLRDFQPSLAQGLIALLEHGDSTTFEESFGPLQFAVEYDCFGTLVDAELKEGGKDVSVTAENREEYVQRYCDWIFNTSVERQFGAFRRGFDKCVGDTLFRQLFLPEELELVICGSPELDFHAFETNTTYQDGYSKTSKIVGWFWEVVHSMSEEEKRNLLAFITGCDRAPVGGLGRLPFVVSRAGPDSDMLPSCHTCFNHMLVPDYSCKEKLEERLRLAVQHCHGFGLM